MAESIRRIKESGIFKYNTLSRSRNDIRLLQILPLGPKENESNMKCSLTTYSRHKGYPPYISISYTWGRSDKMYQIELNERQYDVRENVWQLLRELRTTYPAENFWIDAVCINQLSKSEKSWQVAFMKSTYAAAAQVIVWLGPEYGLSGLAMYYLASRIAPGQTLSSSSTLALPTQAQTRALLKLFSRPLWTRIWVVQEIMLARNITVICGTRCLDWTLISQILTCIRDKVEGISVFDGTSPETPGEILFAEKKYWDIHASQEPGLPLRFLLETWGHMKSTIPIDKVYGILGLSLSHNLTISRGKKTESCRRRSERLGKIDFRISYFKRPVDVFVDVLRSVLLSHDHRDQKLAYDEFLEFGSYLATILAVERDLEMKWIKELYHDPHS